MLFIVALLKTSTSETLRGYSGTNEGTPHVKAWRAGPWIAADIWG
jgi:hypothetical protein